MQCWRHSSSQIPEVDRSKGDPQHSLFTVVYLFLLAIINITNSVIKMALFINFFPEI